MDINHHYKQVLGSFPTGVTVVTTLDNDGNLAGFTASAFSAVSMDPPLILICPSLASSSCKAIRANGKFTVHILGHEQQELAYRFASKKANKLVGIDWRHSELGNAILDGSAAHLECSVWGDYPGGDHAIIVGHVDSLHLPDAAPSPMLYCHGQMGRLPDIRAQV